MFNGESAYTEGEDAGMLIADLGLPMLEWQQGLLDDWGARDASGKPSCITCGTDVPRQNGKNAALEGYESYSLSVCGWHILHTAHRVKTVKKAFRRLEKYFTDDDHPELASMVRQIRRTNGEEAIYLKNGASIEFMARTNGGGRGFDDIQLVVFDEAQELTDAQYEAIMYTLAASSTGERQVIYTGTPPNDQSPGTMFPRVRQSILGGEAGRTTWSSWATPDLPKRDATFADVLDDVYRSNPSMGYVLDESFTETEFAGSSIEGFAHERLDWWSSASGVERPIPKEKWDAAEIDSIGGSYSQKTAYGLKFSPDGATYALSGCKKGRSGYAVELIEIGSTAAGTKPLARFLVDRCGKASCVLVDGLSSADGFCENAKELKAPRGFIVRAGTKEVIAASSGFKDAVGDGSLRHTGQPALTESVTKSARRPIGNRGGWGFGSTDECESMPAESAALALLGVRTSRRNPRRKQKML